MVEHGLWYDKIPKSFQQMNDLPLPLKIMEQYKQMHSVKSLQKDPKNRKFSVGFYACPASAGNRLHEFANGMPNCISYLILIDAKPTLSLS